MDGLAGLDRKDFGVMKFQFRFKVWDKAKREFWAESFTAAELAASLKFPAENIDKYYEFKPDLEPGKTTIAITKEACEKLRDFLLSDEIMGTGEGYSQFIIKAVEMRKRQGV